MLRLLGLWLSMVLLLFFASTGKAETATSVEFNTDFLAKNTLKTIDISRFSKGNLTLPGIYRVDIYVNQNWIAHTDVTFKATAATGNASPCFDRNVLALMGIDFSHLTPAAIASLTANNNTGCLALSQLVPSAKAVYDSNELKLDVSIPQIALKHSARGYVDPALWDTGVTAATLGYNFNTFHVNGGATPSATQSYLGLNGGINLAGWYLRSNGSFSQSSGHGSSYQNVATYLQRDLPSLKSQLIVGDAFTSGNIFDSFGFRGVQLATNQQMYPDSQNGYAPIIKGVARTNARVSVLQNGNLLYETTVAPGPFEINDLYPTGYGGDLNVVVTEADGSKQSFTVPYASLVQLLRPGMTFYSVLAGKVRENFGTPSVFVSQATVQHGFNNVITGYGGTTVAKNYAAALIGLAFNTPIGALAADLTQANTKIVNEGETHTGQSLRLSYSKLINDTHTDFSLAAYRYSSSGYYSLNEALQTQKAFELNYQANTLDRKRNQLQLTVNQALANGEYGTLFMTGSSQSYWNRPGYNTQYQVGYNNRYHSLSYNISIQRQKDITDNRTVTQLYVGISIPLGSETHSPMLTSSATSGKDSNSAQVMLSGLAGENDVFSYSVNGSYANHASQGGFNGQYRSPYANIGASYSQTGHTLQTSASVSGGVVLHSGGITLAQTLGDTIGIVEAKDAVHAHVTGTSPGVAIDRNGYAIVPYLTPYRSNQIGIDPKGMSMDVELQSTAQETVPYAGAVIKMKFKTASGRSALITATSMDGNPIPFGADVFDSNGKNRGIVGQGGRIFIRGLTSSDGVLTVKWGDTVDAQCSLNYHLPAIRKKLLASLDMSEALCK